MIPYQKQPFYFKYQISFVRKSHRLAIGISPPPVQTPLLPKNMG